MYKNIVIDYYYLFNLDISSLGLSVRCYNAIVKGEGSKKQIRKVGDLVSLTSLEILNIFNIGNIALNEIKESLHRFRLYLKDEKIPNYVKLNYDNALNIYNLRELYYYLKKENKFNEIFNLDILVLKIDEYIENYLRKLNINTLGELLNNKEKLQEVGKIYSKIIIDKVHSLGLNFTCESLNREQLEYEFNKLKEKNNQLVLSLNKHL